MTRTLVWVKIPKLCHKRPCYLSFSLGKGGNPYISKTLFKKKKKKKKKKTKLSVLSALPSSMQNISIQTLCGQRMPKFTPKLTKIHFFHKFFLSRNRRVRNLTLYFQLTTPARELTQRHEFWKHHVSSLPRAREMPKPIQKDTDFGNAMFLCYLEPEKHQKSYPEEHEFQRRHNSSLL